MAGSMVVINRLKISYVGISILAIHRSHIVVTDLQLLPSVWRIWGAEPQYVN